MASILAEAVIAASKPSARKLMIAYRRQYEPLNLHATDLMRSRLLGEARTVVANMGRQAVLADLSITPRVDRELSGSGVLTRE